MSRPSPIRILVVCTGNACRSPMAEGFLRVWGGPRVEVYSAGVAPIGVHPRAVAAMAELDIDISAQTSTSLNACRSRPIDYLITLSEEARAHCARLFRETDRVHWPVDDPYFASGTVEQQATKFRQVRDEIGEKTRSFLSEIVNRSG